MRFIDRVWIWLDMYDRALSQGVRLAETGWCSPRLDV